MLYRPTIAKNIQIPALLALALGLSACAGADYKPVVDMRGHSETAYDNDLAVCQQTARTVRNNTDIAEDAGIGAVGGAAGGALLGAIGGNPGLGAGVGALGEERIVKNCMRDRGYAVLGQIREPPLSPARS